MGARRNGPNKVDRHKESMIDLHEQYLREAASQGAQIMCFQELFADRIFVRSKKLNITVTQKLYRYNCKAFSGASGRVRMVLVLPMYEKEKKVSCTIQRQ